MNNYTLNYVAGFDPFQYVEQAVSKEGEYLFQNDGSPLQYMTTEAKKMWFRMKNPSGAIVSRRETMDNPATVRYRVEVFEHKDDVNPIVSWEHQETAKGVEDFDMLCSKVQTIALGKALSAAGFGAEIEAILHLKTEGEITNEENFALAKEEVKEELKKTKKAKKDDKKKDEKVEKGVSDED
ncbi:MAG: hypothetical protein IK121_06925, partial [Lachnospiraceae bacterium]|nr:hypothetical protein [Lachnospiraceae bacterium]